MWVEQRNLFADLDELTDRLDIDSMEAVEAGLRAYDGVPLVVSHDEAFLEAVGLRVYAWLTPAPDRRPAGFGKGGLVHVLRRFPGPAHGHEKPAGLLPKSV
jgi:ATPase subunit of ABC transporter with duplicated ATPase domains